MNGKKQKQMIYKNNHIVFNEKVIDIDIKKTLLCISKGETILTGICR